jgi:hypothetical protein
MPANLTLVEGFEPLKVDDSLTLTPAQHAACVKLLDGDLTLAQIAKQTGYSSQGSLCRFLRSEQGQAGLRKLTQAMLAQAGAIGLKTMLELAQDRKQSGVVRQKAAADLMDRGMGVAAPVQPERHAAAGGISININVKRRENGDEAIDISPAEPE